MPTPQQYRKLRDALINAFPQRSSLEQLLFFELGKNLNQITKDSDLQYVAFQLIQTAEAQGWLLTLVRVAQKENPGNLNLQAIATELLEDNSTPSTSNNINPKNEPNSSKEDTIAKYRKKVEEFLADDGEISFVESEILKSLQSELELTEEETRAVRDEVLKPLGIYQENLDKYRQVFTKLVDEQGYPLSSKNKAELKKLQEFLKLKDEDTDLLFKEAEQLEVEKLRQQATLSDNYGSRDQPSVNTNPPNNPPAQPVSQVFHLSNRNRYQVTNQWGGPSALWQDGG